MDRASTREQSRSKYEYAYARPAYINDPLVTGIFIGTVLLLFGLGIVAYATKSVFFIDAIVSIGIVSIVYYYRKLLLFSWEGTLLCCIGWLMNMLGTLGAYDILVLGIGWDKGLHFVSILGVTLLVYAYLARTGLNLIELSILTFFIAQGFGALNEVLEFVGTHYFGAGQGLFGMMNGLTEPTNGRFDTHYDLIANTAAIALGLVYATISNQVYKRKARTAST